MSESELCELDDLAALLSEPDRNRERLEEMRCEKEKFFILTNNTQNIYYDMFR